MSPQKFVRQTFSRINSLLSMSEVEDNVGTMSFADLSPLAIKTRIYIMQYIEMIIGPWTSAMGYEKDIIPYKRSGVLRIFNTKDLYGRFLDDPNMTIRLIFHSISVKFKQMNVQFLKIITEIPFHRLKSLKLFLCKNLFFILDCMKGNYVSEADCLSMDDFPIERRPIRLIRGVQRRRRRRRPREINLGISRIISKNDSPIFPFQKMTALDSISIVVKDYSILNETIISKIAKLRNLTTVVISVKRYRGYKSSQWRKLDCCPLTLRVMKTIVSKASGGTYHLYS